MNCRIASLVLGSVAGLSVVGCPGVSRDILACIKSTNSDYELVPTLTFSSPTAELAASEDMLEIRLRALVINDIVGNDFERCILKSAAVLDTSRPADTISSGESSLALLSKEVRDEIDREVESNKAKLPGGDASSSGQEISVDESIKQVKDKIARKIVTSLAADYSIEITVHSTRFSGPEVGTLKFTKNVKQREAGSPVTEVGDWSQLVYRGKGLDALEVGVRLKRSSPLASLITKETDRLKKSTFFSDLLSTALSPIGGGMFSHLGSLIGGRIDKKVADIAADNYGAKPDMGSGDWMITTSADQKPSGSSQAFIGANVIALQVKRPTARSAASGPVEAFRANLEITKKK